MIEKQAIEFLNKLFQKIEEHRIDLKNWEIDHLCYRTSTHEKYLSTKELFQNLGQLLTESDVNGRPIATYKLEKPIIFDKWIIDLVEVPAPKQGKTVRDGFEHIEIVVDETFESILKQYPHLNFNQKGLTKSLNPELEIEFDDTAIKFHHKSLEHIINIEKNPKIMGFLEKYLIHFQEFNPCFSGTTPLLIENSNSSLKILFEANSLDRFSSKVEETFKDLKNYSIRKTHYQRESSIFVKFDYENLPIEFVCQQGSVLKQLSNQNFILEGRLLKIFGHPLKEKVNKLMREGYNTEMAFKLALDIPELLELSKESDNDLFKRFSPSIKSL